MGCGKSKHDVVTGNTISQSKRLSEQDAKKIKDAETKPEEATKDTETNPEKATNDTNTNSPVQQQEVEKAKEDSKPLVQQQQSENAAKEDFTGGTVETVADTKNEKVNANLNERDAKKESNEKQGGIKEEEQGSLVSHIDAIAPPAVKEGVPEETKKLSNTADEKEEEPMKLKEENLVKEAKVVPTVEVKDLATTEQEQEQEKNPNAIEKHVTDSSAEDAKTN